MSILGFQNTQIRQFVTNDNIQNTHLNIFSGYVAYFRSRTIIQISRLLALSRSTYLKFYRHFRRILNQL